VIILGQQLLIHPNLAFLHAQLNYLDSISIDMFNIGITILWKPLFALPSELNVLGAFLKDNEVAFFAMVN